MKNSLKAALIGFSQDQLATKRLGTWLGPVILSILLRKQDLEVGQSQPYLSHNSSTLSLQVGLRYSLMIFLVIYPQMFFLQSHGFLTRIFFSLGLKILGNSTWSLQAGAHWKIKLRSPQLGARMSSPKMESLDFWRGNQSVGTIRFSQEQSRLNSCSDILLLQTTRKWFWCEI